MKRYIIFLISISCIILAIFFNWYTEKNKAGRLITSYNAEYNMYIDKEITGVDVTTVINKAIDNNEKNNIKKDDIGSYEDDEKYCTKVFVKIAKDKDHYPMEAIEKVGIGKFTNLYGMLNFKCTNIKYHKNGRISELYYEIID